MNDKYENYKIIANACASYEDVDALMSILDEDYDITGRQYYALKEIAIRSAYEYPTSK